MKIADLKPGVSIKVRIQGEDDLVIKKVGNIRHEPNGDVHIWSDDMKTLVTGIRRGDELINVKSN